MGPKTYPHRGSRGFSFAVGHAESLFECVDELAAKEFTQHFLGKEVVVAGTNPTGAIRRETAGRHEAMHMRVSGELLAPCMQDAEEADLCAEVSGIARGRNDKPESTLLPKSGVKFNVFQQIGPKIDICSQNLCSSRSNFTKVASAFQRFQPVNSTQ